MMEPEADRYKTEYIDAAKVREAQAQMVDEPTATQLAQFFRALSDPTRVRIISALSASELCVFDLAATLGMSQSAISHQLRLLRQLRLVRWRKVGQLVYYALDDEHVSSLFQQGLDHVKHS
ncbi:MAG: helix-turn-helix transcriptional regulator [Chloroflexi bacterium]|nr:helix-turn-helix transcriptional regulator [Chloroflexota bacterium]